MIAPFSYGELLHLTQRSNLSCLVAECVPDNLLHLHSAEKLINQTSGCFCDVEIVLNLHLKSSRIQFSSK